MDRSIHRLTITSPGGMADSTRIQKRDISNISSPKRNPVLADIFARLGYMERQGNGCKKITNSYRAITIAVTNWSRNSIPMQARSKFAV